MSGIVIELKPSSELMLLTDALVRSIDGLSSAIERLLVARPIADPPEAPSPAPAGTVVDASSQAATEDRTEVPTPAATVPDAVVAGTKRFPGDWATDARRDVLRRMYPSDVRGSAIMAELQKLPGPDLPKWEVVQTFAIQSLRLKRSDPQASRRPALRAVPTADAEQAIIEASVRASSDAFAKAALDKAPVPRPNLGSDRMTKAMQLPEGPIDRSTPIVADFEQIRHWAGPRGVQFNTWADLSAVNIKARELGHRPFARANAVART